MLLPANRAALLLTLTQGISNDYLEPHKSREGRGLGSGVPLKDRGSGGITSGKILKFVTQFELFWCIWATNDGFPVFRLHEQNISIMQVVWTLF